MKVLKPLSLGLLTRPFEYRQRCYCGVSILAMVPLAGPARLGSELAMWPLVARVLGADAIVDEGMPKQRAEFLVGGRAWKDAAQAGNLCRVSVRLGQVEKSLNVFGDRFFEGDTVTSPLPFDCIPLSWAAAFGGEGFPENPLGKGYSSTRDEDGRKRYPLPNIEYGDDMLARPGGRSRPAGFGTVPLEWPQRQRLAGTYDDRWLKSDYPGLASDIDWRFFNMASPDQQFDQAFKGDEGYSLKNLHPQKNRIEGQLPGFSARCFLRRSAADQLEELTCRLTTVWFLPEAEQAILIWHASVEVEAPDASDVGELLIAAEHSDRPRDMAHYREVYQRRMDQEWGGIAALEESALVPEDAVDESALLRPDPVPVKSNPRFDFMNHRMARERNEGELRIRKALEPLGANIPVLSEPDIGFEPDALAERPLSELPAVINSLRRLHQEKQKEVALKQREGLAQIEAEMQSLSERVVGAEVKTGRTRSSAPVVRASEEHSKIQAQLDSISSPGFDKTALTDALLGSDMRQALEMAENQSIAAYQRSAHLLDEMADTEQGREIAAKLRESIRRQHMLACRDFSRADFSDQSLDGLNLSSAFLESARFENASLLSCLFDKAVLSRSDFSGVDCRDVSFVEANLGRSSWRRARLEDCELSGAELYEADFTGSSVARCSFKNASMMNCILDESSLMDCSFSDWLFTDASLREITLTGSSLGMVVFVNMSLDRINLDGTSIDQLVLINSRVSGLSFRAARLDSFVVCGDSVFKDCDFSEADMANANLRGAVLERCDFSGANLTGSDFSDCSAAGSTFERVRARNARFVNACLNEVVFKSSDLMEAMLERADIRGASFEACNLYGLDLARAHVDRQTKFNGAITSKMRTHPMRFREPSRS